MSYDLIDRYSLGLIVAVSVVAIEVVNRMSHLIQSCISASVAVALLLLGSLQTILHISINISVYTSASAAVPPQALTLGSCRGEWQQSRPSTLDWHHSQSKLFSSINTNVSIGIEPVITCMSEAHSQDNY